MKFRGENLGRAKGVKAIYFFRLVRVYLFIMGFNRYKEWIFQLD